MTALVKHRSFVRAFVMDIDKTKAAIVSFIAYRKASVEVRETTETYFDARTGRLRLTVDDKNTSAEAKLTYYNDGLQTDGSYGFWGSSAMIDREEDISVHDILALSMGVLGVIKKRRTSIVVNEDLSIFLEEMESVGNFITIQTVTHLGEELDRKKTLVSVLLKEFYIDEANITESEDIDILLEKRGEDDAY